MAGYEDWGAVPDTIGKSNVVIRPVTEASPYKDWGAVPDVQPSVIEDLNKAIPSATAKGVIAANPFVSIPTMGDLAFRGAGWAARHDPTGTISPEVAKDIQSGVDTIHQKMAPFTYGPVVQKAEEFRKKYEGPSWLPDWALPNKSGVPLTYDPKTTTGKYVAAPLQILPSAMTGGSGLLPKATNAASNMVRAIMGGLTSEGLGQFAEKYLPETLFGQPTAQWARGIGGFGGAAFGPSVVRKGFTPYPAEAKHQQAVDTLKVGGATNKDFTVSTATGKARQTESNLGNPEELTAKDNSVVTKVIGNQAGMPPNTTNFTPEAFAEARKGFLPYLDAVEHAEIKGKLNNTSNYDDLVRQLAAIRRAAVPALHKKVDALDDVINQITTSSTGVKAYSILGSRYKELRSIIQQEAKDATGDLKDSLVEVRKALDNAMSKELPFNLQVKHRQFANFKLLEGAKNLTENQQVTPKIMRKEIMNQWGPRAYNAAPPDSMAAYTHAAQQVFPKRPEKVLEPSGMTKAAGASLGLLASLIGAPAEKAFALYGGSAMLAAPLQKGGRAIGRSIYFNPMVQSLLKNQRFQPGPTTAMDPVTAARLLKYPGAAGLLTNQTSQPSQ